MLSGSGTAGLTRASVNRSEVKNCMAKRMEPRQKRVMRAIMTTVLNFFSARILKMFIAFLSRGYVFDQLFLGTFHSRI